MKPRFSGPLAARYVILATLFSLSAVAAHAQQSYRNIVNEKFRTVSDGPQSALIVDIRDPADAAGVRKTIEEQVGPRLQARNSALHREIDFLRSHRLVKPGQQLILGDAVLLRHNGRLLMPPPPNGPRTRDNNQLTYVIPTSGDGAWTPAAANELRQIVDLLYPELVRVLGIPAARANYNVTILNKDPRFGKVDEVIGALVVYNASGGLEIWFPTFSAWETRFLAMAHSIAQTFHGPARIAYDAWEIGMARAATVIAARDLQPQIIQLGQSVNPANGFFFTPFYDLLNQPALGNNTFTPPTKSNQNFVPTTLSGMLVPRLQMSSTAWLKCYIENPTFLSRFNAAYYAAFVADPKVANDVTRLRTFLRSVLPTVELQPVDDWYEQQYVLDTSVTPGPKIYAYTLPTFPTAGQGNDSGAAVFLVYYETTRTGDELDRDGSVDVVYWDYLFANRLFLPSFEKVTIAGGFGTVAPFFANIGGNPADQMRVAMDFPVNKDYVRVYFPAGETGTQAQPNDFSGVVVGADSGTLNLIYENGAAFNLPVKQGVFGGRSSSGSVPNNFSRTRMIFTPDTGAPVTAQRNTAFNNTLGVAPIFVVGAPSTVTTLTHTFAGGPQMISLPIRPLTSDLARVLGTNPNTTLLAQYRQDLPVPPNPDKYVRYPSLGLYQPGYGLWSNFGTAVNATSIKGERTDTQRNVSVSLQFGWNVVGTPYAATVNVATDLQFQYLGSDPVGFSQAITNGWIAAGVIGYSPSAGYQDITTTSDVSFPRNALESWKGYWVRVIVPEGVTITYLNPSRASRAAGRSRADENPSTPGWRIPLQLRDGSGHTSFALLGQAPNASESFHPALDIASPPAFPGTGGPAIRFPHRDWDSASDGRAVEFLSDFRSLGARSTWDLTVTAPNPGESYTLTWSDTAALPRGTRVTLVDLESGTRQVMNSSSSYTFRPGAPTRRFQILAEPHAPGRIFVSNVHVSTPPVPGRGVSAVTLSYELSGAAETTVEIRLGGRTVRRLTSGRAATAGLNQMVWDTKDDQGRSVAAGAYTVQITARTSDGEQTRTVTPLLLTR